MPWPVDTVAGMKVFVLPFLIGSLGGLIGALCGVGGGIIMVPAFVLLLGLSQQQAVATSLSVIVVTSLAATVRNWSSSLIDWKVFAAAAVGGCLVAFLAAGWMKSLSNETLTRIFAFVLIGMGFRMLFAKA